MEKLLCPSCGGENLAEARFCTACGSSLSKSKPDVCSQCGRAVGGKDNFCPACGTKLREGIGGADYNRIPKTAPWAALGLVAVGLIFIFIFVTSQSRPPGAPPDNVPTSSEPPLPQLTEADIAQLPKDFKKLVEMGNHYFDHQQFHDALVLYRRALEIDSTNLDVRTDYAACLNFMGDFDGAKKQLEKVLAQKPNHIVATFNLGVVFINLGQNQKARQYWKKYLELDPASPRAQEVKKMLLELE